MIRSVGKARNQRRGIKAAAGTAVVAMAMMTLSVQTHAGFSPNTTPGSAPHGTWGQIRNGGFERGASGWVTTGGANAFGGGSHSGYVHMDLVALPQLVVAAVSQPLRMPSNLRHATLRFWTEDWSCGSSIRLDLSVFSGGRHHLLTTIDGGAACGNGWREHAVALDGFQGKPVTVRFAARYGTDAVGALFYLDDVSLR